MTPYNSRRERSGGDGVLLGLVLGIGRGRKRRQGLVLLVLGVEYPSLRDLPLDIDDVRPVGILKLFPNLRQFRDVGLRRFRIPGAGGTEGAREMCHGLDLRQKARAHRELRRALPVAALDGVARR